MNYKKQNIRQWKQITKGTPMKITIKNIMLEGLSMIELPHLKHKDSLLKLPNSPFFSFFP
jgi:hypothetical protein